MAKYFGAIGFTTSVETVPGVWDDQIVEKTYRGDILQNIRRWQEGNDQINDNFRVNNRISLLADTYLYENIPAIKYIIWMGTKWKVSSATINRPRIIFEIGDVYNATSS